MQTNRILPDTEGRRRYERAESTDGQKEQVRWKHFPLLSCWRSWVMFVKYSLAALWRQKTVVSRSIRPGETRVPPPGPIHRSNASHFPRAPVGFGQSATMCGRIVDDLTTEQIAHQYRIVEAARPVVEHRPNYSLRPTGTLRAVRLDPDGKRELAALRWGFVPHWSREVPKQAWINAKAETIAEKGVRRAPCPGARDRVLRVAKAARRQEAAVLHLPARRPDDLRRNLGDVARGQGG